MPLFADATDIAASIKAGKTTATQVLKAHFARVDAYNPDLNAIIWQDRDNAMKRAEDLDADAAIGKFHGPLHGVPVTVKEAFDLVGSPSTWGNPAMRDNYPEADALLVKRYKDAGAVIFGKTNVPLDLADWQSFNEIYGTTKNPWDLSRTPGGSSGGSAAALASGMSALEAGSDIGSSIRNPAHYCGVFGLKPTWNVVPMQGHQPPGFVSDIDIAVTGPMTRSARDLKLAFDVLVGADDTTKSAWATACPADPRQSLKDFRVAIKLGDPACPIDETYRNALEAFAEKISRAGATISFSAAPKIDTAKHFDVYIGLLGAALALGTSESAVADELAYAEANVSGEALRIMRTRMAGKNIRHADWIMLDNARNLAARAFATFFDSWDILLAPVCASAAFERNENGRRCERELTINGQQQPELQQLFWSGYSGVVGLPSAVGPAGFVDHLPVGYQAIAGHGKDYTALAFAQAVEREIGGFTSPPDRRS